MLVQARESEKCERCQKVSKLFVGTNTAEPHAPAALRRFPPLCAMPRAVHVLHDGARRRILHFFWCGEDMCVGETRSSNCQTIQIENVSSKL
jgi:hypothetical protein